MTSAGVSPAPEGDRFAGISRAVERETRYRQRMLRIYLALLLIPLAILVVFLVFGRSDGAEIQAVKVAYAAVQPTLAHVRALDTVVPQLRDASHRLERQERRVAILQDSQRVLAASIVPVVDTVRHLAANIADVRAAQVLIPQLRAQVAALQDSQRTAIRNLEVLRQSVRSLETSVKSVEVLRLRVDSVQTKLNRIDPKVFRGQVMRPTRP